MRALFTLVMLAGSALITWGSVSYFVDGDMHPFILEKLDEGLRFERVWTAALYTHVVAASLAFPACLALVSRTLMKRAPRVHRWLGRVTGVIVLFALVPSGAWMAFWAKGGAVSSVGFLASGAIVAVAMVQGVRTARRKDYVAHRRCTAHVLAQMSVAVTSRARLIAFDRAAVDPTVAYLVALWLPVVMSALAAELLTRRTREALPIPAAARALVLEPAR